MRPPQQDFDQSVGACHARRRTWHDWGTLARVSVSDCTSTSGENMTIRPPDHEFHPVDRRSIRPIACWCVNTWGTNRIHGTHGIYRSHRAHMTYWSSWNNFPRRIPIRILVTRRSKLKVRRHWAKRKLRRERIIPRLSRSVHLSGLADLTRPHVAKTDIQVLSRRQSLQCRSFIHVAVRAPEDEASKYDDRHSINRTIPPLQSSTDGPNHGGCTPVRGAS